MGIRQTINEKPALTTAVTGGVILLAIVVIIWQGCGGSGGEGGLVSDKAFFTIDDGKTFFVDKSSNIPPFQKDGKFAVRAQVFTCDDGKTKFVGYLEMYAPQDKAMMEAMAKGQTARSPGPMPTPYMSGQPLVKKPGAPQNAWVGISPATSMLYQQVVSVRCPDGRNENLSRVFPE